MAFLFSGLSIISLICFSTFIYYVLNCNLTIKFLSFGGKVWLLNISFDSTTISILLMLLICFLYVLRYTHHYFGGEIAGFELNKIICLFVRVMASLVCTGDYLTTLIFWEYLGVVSFFLILFYDSYLSLRSSIITLVSSRFGDVCLFLLIMLGSLYINNVWFTLFIFFFIIFTKSASFPFTRWLLEAMRAPTPVRSLVHSSTLVAAGVWFAMRYDFLLYFNKSFVFSILLLLTIFVTGICCFFFVDLKKIVALSTCKKISWCVLYLIFGDCILSLFQLIRHGVSKCMLFMLVGDVMSGSGGSQARNCIYSPSLYSKWGIFSLFSVILGLSGAPFIGVFFTKHFLLTKFLKIFSFTLFCVVLLCVFLSYFYSFRLCAIIIKLKSSIVRGVLFFFKTGLMVYFWLFVNYFISLILDECKVLVFSVSWNLIGFQLISCITSYYLYSRKLFRKWRSSLFGCDKLVESFYSIYIQLYKFITIFFYRWDNYMMTLFSSRGVSIISTYTIKFLNILVMLILIFLMCYVIIY